MSCDDLIAILDDKSDGLPSLEKSITTLLLAGVDKTSIIKHVDNAHAKQFATRAVDKRFKPE